MLLSYSKDQRNKNISKFIVFLKKSSSKEQLMFWGSRLRKAKKAKKRIN